MRKIFIVTERRADYSRFKTILDLIKNDSELDYILVVTGMHLKKNHGYTLREIIKDGFKVHETFDMFLEEEDSGAAMVRSFAEAARQLSIILQRHEPDIILSGFDIAANMAVTIAGAHMNIPVAHIQGGEVTGTIDESIRHAMSKFAHYHFAGNNDAAERLVKLGENPKNIFNVGCPSIDSILSVPDDPDVLKKFGLKEEFYLVLQHPVTSEANDSKVNIEGTILAVKDLGIDTLVIMPNNDAGYSSIVNLITKSGLKTVESLSIEDYVNLLKRCSALIGNSSSGIHETATFNIPTVNIGTRQQGRLKSNNVIDCDYGKENVKKAIIKSQSLKGKNFKKIYGNGTSAMLIVAKLKAIDIGLKVIQKRITY